MVFAYAFDLPRRISLLLLFFARRPTGRIRDAFNARGRQRFAVSLKSYSAGHRENATISTRPTSFVYRRLVSVRERKNVYRITIPSPASVVRRVNVPSGPPPAISIKFVTISRRGRRSFITIHTIRRNIRRVVYYRRAPRRKIQSTSYSAETRAYAFTYSFLAELRPRNAFQLFQTTQITVAKPIIYLLPAAFSIPRQRSCNNINILFSPRVARSYVCLFSK